MSESASRYCELSSIIEGSCEGTPEVDVVVPSDDIGEPVKTGTVRDIEVELVVIVVLMAVQRTEENTKRISRQSDNKFSQIFTGTLLLLQETCLHLFPTKISVKYLMCHGKHFSLMPEKWLGYLTCI